MPADPPRHHQKVAEDCWRMIVVLMGDPKPTPEELDRAAERLIEMACDSAAESARIALGHLPRGMR